MKKTYISKLLAMLTAVCLLLSVLAAVPVSADTTTPDGTTVLYKELPVGTQTRGNETRLVMKITGDEATIVTYSEVGFYVTIDGETTRIAVDSLYDSFYNNGSLVTAAELGCTYVAILELGALAPYTKVQAQGYAVTEDRQTAGDPAVIKGNVDIKLPNVATYTYRVGNQNNVSLGNLFNAAPYAKVKPAKVEISTETVSGTATAAYTANATDWTAGTVKFDGTGTVKMTVDYAADKPVELNLEVVDAVNVTAAANATENNVVLLKNIGATQIKVANGYAFYGNGFTITFSGDGRANGAIGLSAGFINVESGATLDNAQVICPIFPAAFLYASEVTASSNAVSSADTTHFKYQFSAVSVKGDATISNCFIYGARNNILAMGSATIKNTVCECGSFANIYSTAENTSTLRLIDVTTSQHIVEDSFNAGKSVMGFGIVSGRADRGTSSTETNTKIMIEGELTQYNWISADMTPDHSTFASTLMSTALKQTKYQHIYNGETYVNTGIIYLNNMNETVEPTVDGYEGSVVSLTGVGSAHVYSITDGTVESYTFKENYHPTEQGESPVVISYPGIDFVKTYNATTDEYELGYTVPELLPGSKFNLDVSKINATISGVAQAITVKNDSGKVVNGIQEIDSSCSFAITVENNNKRFRIILSVKAADAPAPEITTKPNLEYVYLGKSDANSFAVDVFTGMEITYYSNSEKKVVTKKVSDIVPSQAGGKINDTNTFTVDVNDEIKIKVTSASAFHSKENSGNGNPFYVSGKYYFGGTYQGLSNSSMNSGRTCKFTYSIEDYAGHTVANTTATTGEYSVTITGKGSKYYSSSDFAKGTLKEATSGGGGSGCVTGDTLITMADDSQKAISEVKAGENVIAFDHEKGEYVSVPAMAVFNHGYGLYNTVKLNFSDETELNLVIGHSFFDLDLNKYVEIYPENCQDFIGHRFVRYEGDNTISSATLISATAAIEYTECWGMFSYSTLSVITNGMLSAPNCEGIYNYFEYDENLKYNESKMLKDIEEYGTYTYEDWAEYISEYVYDGFNFKYFKVAVEKGIVPMETYFGYIDLLNYLYSIN